MLVVVSLNARRHERSELVDLFAGRRGVGVENTGELHTELASAILLETPGLQSPTKSVSGLIPPRIGAPL